ncbi:alanine racemase [Propioniciclava sp. MC1595]|uniref:alanine racemase n=1 Tax=Propioniciclava sp. MC1595 TaxID=2760308 RepID=UPI00166221FF|nr:alanine racemase [Propioniciclava sp. MC1595]MBB1496155.1 alanine racemase [Propioniciclava sp. MC1595]QTE25742.1 alanine racemase [Propioniciclava sp. MC1595]
MFHATTATTRLDHIRANLHAIRARVGDRRVLVAVKADAYGHGAIGVSRMVEATGAADWLGVATVDEALQIRDAGVRLPILKLSHALTDDEVAACITRDIDLAVVSADSIDQVGRVAGEVGRTASVHLKVDTGMRRIGCEPTAAPDLARRVDAAGLRLRGLFSHLPVSDTEAGREFTERQIALFARVADDVAAARGRVELVHLANSGGVMMHPGSWFDMVRPGIMVCGSKPDVTTADTVPLLPGLEWTTRVTFVKGVAAGESVGYGRTWTAPQDTVVATIPVGYGDGYSRLLSNRGRVLIGGRSCPIVGRVCMDQVMVDVGPGSSVDVGDEVVLIGRSGAEEITVSEVADLMGTIPYEVTCLINARVARAVVG